MSNSRQTVGRANALGFTLIELMAVVLIIGVLAVLAVGGYRKVTNTSRTAEAVNMIGATRVAQESAKTESGSYVNATGQLIVNLSGVGATNALCYPPGTPTDRTVSWSGHAASSVVTAWNQLAVSATGPVSYCYSTVAGAAGQSASGFTFTHDGDVVTFPGASDPLIVRGPWYIVGAVRDNDGNGAFSSLVGTSWSNNVMYDQQGE